MPHPKGQNGPRASAYGQNILTVICPDDDVSYGQRHSLNPYGKPPPPQTLGQGRKSSIEVDTWHSRVRPSVLDEESLFSVNLPPIQPIGRRMSRHCSGGKSSPSSGGPSTRRKLMYRSFQVFSLLIVAVSVYALVENVRYLLQMYGSDGERETLQRDGSAKELYNIHQELQSWILHDKPPPHPQPLSLDSDSIFNKKRKREFLISTSTEKSDEPESGSSRYIVDIESLAFNLNNSSMCVKSNSSLARGDGIYFVIIVHSSPEHFEARQAIRSTWGSVKSLKSFTIRLIFILGKTGTWVEDADLVESSITRESEIFGDIVTGTFVDSYRNLTYKHLLGYKWAAEFCPGASFILKTDDDAFIDMFQLFDFITRIYGFKPAQGTLICNVFPEGTKPVRSTDERGTKWSVTLEDYPHPIYPKYCGGLAYLATPDVVKRILTVSDKVRFFWIDDVFVTGVLRELAGIEPFYLNLRYTYEPERYRKWLSYSASKNSSYQSTHHYQHSSNSSSNNSYSTVTSVTKMGVVNKKFSFIIAHVERGPKFSEEMNHLWRKTLRAWSEQSA